MTRTALELTKLPYLASGIFITTDQGANFKSNLFRELSNLLGTNRIQCCAYHPKANGLVERLHRHLKSAIKAHENSKWSKIIPIVLLGMRSAVKKDINATCAELVFGTTLRIISPQTSLPPTAIKPMSYSYVRK
ncbi:transposon Tf2-6 polyprotein [Nephila pilipes]|uniref:Transposon Tf2-6 polyprotein n=1 Tax=Nephila pilipes TaxID=299642 RepID=A0A8X6NT78_NEPPI|nr:transposon Tf2-6 polyprotein [Nephila pilipes]GFT30460.1 transposon Tf2-6 polyprotein [Nephila pilipes]GFU17833.1 transposon Tf2-6 polyprotein [Nephila pilipes]GFU25770.1 transposon Tf2-6 polyprotein [Nephila pilipes]